MSQRYIGPGRSDKAKMTTERQLVLSIEGDLTTFWQTNWMKAAWNRADLIAFLKVFYGLRYYCLNTDMGNEWLRLLQNNPGGESGETKH